MEMNGSPRKLRSGAWGVGIEAPPSKADMIGAIVTVATKAGKTWDARIESVVFRNDEYALVAVADLREEDAALRRAEGLEASWLNSQVNYA